MSYWLGSADRQSPWMRTLLAPLAVRMQSAKIVHHIAPSLGWHSTPPRGTLILQFLQWEEDNPRWISSFPRVPVSPHGNYRKDKQKRTPEISERWRRGGAKVMIMRPSVKGTLGRGTCQCEGPELGTYLMCSKTKRPLYLEQSEQVKKEYDSVKPDLIWSFNIYDINSEKMESHWRDFN